MQSMRNWMRNWMRTGKDEGEECENDEKIRREKRDARMQKCEKKRESGKKCKIARAEDPVGVEKKSEVVGAVSGGRKEEGAGRQNMAGAVEAGRRIDEKEEGSIDDKK